MPGGGSCQGVQSSGAQLAVPFRAVFVGGEGAPDGDAGPVAGGGWEWDGMGLGGVPMGATRHALYGLIACLRWLFGVCCACLELYRIRCELISVNHTCVHAESRCVLANAFAISRISRGEKTALSITYYQHYLLTVRY